jgi:hypothetical protein
MEADSHYFDELLKESMESYSRSESGSDPKDHDLVTKEMIACWEKDFTQRFGESPTDFLIQQREAGIKKIMARKPAPSIAVLVSPPPVESVAHHEMATSRPAETLGRMKFEFKTEEEPSSPLPHTASPRSTFTLHSKRADVFNRFLVGVSFLILLVICIILTLKYFSDRDLALKMRLVTPQSKLQPTKHLTQVDGEIAIVEDANTTTNKQGDASMRNAHLATGTAESSASNQQSDASYTPEILKQIPDKKRNRETSQQDPILTGQYYVDSMNKKIEEERGQHVVNKQVIKEQSQTNQQSYQFFHQAPMVQPKKILSKRFESTSAIGDTPVSITNAAFNPETPVTPVGN